MKKIKLKATEAEIKALVEILDEYSASIGGGEDDSLGIKRLKKVDNLLKKNGIDRNYK